MIIINKYINNKKKLLISFFFQNILSKFFIIFFVFIKLLFNFFSKFSLLDNCAVLFISISQFLVV